MTLRQLSVVLLGTAGACFWSAGAVAADLTVPDGTIVQDTELPAVSGINGKWEFDPGILNGTGQIRAAGSLSLPLGDRFGVQGDVMATWSAGNLVYAGALHAFTRDPSRYLAGITAGVVVYPGATLTGIGPEGELYLDRLSIEGWAGVASLDYVNPAMLDLQGFFAFGDVAYYPHDDLRLSLGGSDVLGDLALHAGAEYLYHGLGAPLSLTADARLHASGDYSITVGLKGYFGGDDSGKTLIDRHRQDDPRNRAVDFFNGAGSKPYNTPPEATDPETSADVCESFGGIWQGSWCELQTQGSNITEEGCNWLIEQYPLVDYYWSGSECLID